MSVVVTGSPDISTLEFSALFDLSTPAPSIKLTNLSAITNPANLTFDVTLISPSGITLCHITNFNATAAWSTYVIAVVIPLILGHVEWGGIGYSIAVKVTDTTAHTATLTKSIILARPLGNGQNSKDNNGVSFFCVTTKCDIAKLLVEDNSVYLYNGLVGSQISKLLTLVYPSIAADNTPKAFVKNGSFSNLLISLYADGDGYQLLANTVFEYIVDAVNLLYVRIMYVFKSTFSVNCMTDICGIANGLVKLNQDLQDGCTPEQRNNLIAINTNFNLILAAKIQPQCYLDISALINACISLLGAYYTKSCCTYGIYDNSAAITDDDDRGFAIQLDPGAVQYQTTGKGFLSKVIVNNPSVSIINVSVGKVASLTNIVSATAIPASGFKALDTNDLSASGPQVYNFGGVQADTLLILIFQPLL